MLVTLKMKKITSLTLIISFFFLSVYAQDHITTKFHDLKDASSDYYAHINNLVEEYSSIDDFSGVVLVSKDTSIIYHQAFGLADRRFEISNTLDTKFSIGSMTKAFTGYVIYSLIKEGRLDPQSPIGQYYPGLHDSVKIVTIKELLGHLSGIWHYNKYDDYRENLFPRSFTNNEFLSLFIDEGLRRAPGNVRSYSSIGYNLLGLIAEEITQRPLSELFNDYIFSPLNMNSSHLAVANREFKNHARGYRFDIFEGYLPERFRHPSTLYAGGGAISNTLDLLKWSNHLITLYNLNPENIFFQPILDNQGQKGFEGYSYGISTFLPMLEDTLVAFWHEGQLGGNRTVITTLPEEQITIVALSNRRGAPVMRMTKNIIEILRNRPIPFPPKQPYISVMWDELSRGNISEAIEIYEDVRIAQDTKFDFRDSFELVYLANYLKENKRKHESVEILEIASVDFPKDLEVKLSLAAGYIDISNENKARNVLKNVIEADKHNTMALKLLQSLD